MSKKRAGTVLLLLGVLIAVGVSFMVFAQARRAADTARMESVEVLVAAQDIPERTLVIAPFLATKRMLPSSLPMAAMVKADQAVGKMTTAPILAGEFILPGKLVEADGRAGLTFTIPKGRVVMTMPASDILSTGAVRSGDQVDLLVTIRPPERDEHPGQPPPGATPGPMPPSPTSVADLDVGTTQMTMQNLKVLAIGLVNMPEPVPGAENDQKVRSVNDRAPSSQSLITFAVERQDALILKALKDTRRVKLELVLRANGDDEVVQTDPVTLNTIIARYKFRAVPTPRPDALP